MRPARVEILPVGIHSLGAGGSTAQAHRLPVDHAAWPPRRLAASLLLVLGVAACGDRQIGGTTDVESSTTSEDAALTSSPEAAPTSQADAALGSQMGWTPSGNRTVAPALRKVLAWQDAYASEDRLSELSDSELLTVSQRGPCRWAAAATRRLLASGKLNSVPGRPASNDLAEFAHRLCVAAMLDNKAAVQSFIAPGRQIVFTIWSCVQGTEQEAATSDALYEAVKQDMAPWGLTEEDWIDFGDGPFFVPESRDYLFPKTIDQYFPRISANLECLGDPQAPDGYACHELTADGISFVIRASPVTQDLYLDSIERRRDMGCNC